MSSMFLYTDDDDSEQHINIDELYNKNQQRDLKQLSIFNKILNRIHTRIKHTARTKKVDKFIWYNVPEYIFGEPCYNQGDCIGYLVMKLQKNGFHTKYVHPNTLFVINEVYEYRKNTSVPICFTLDAGANIHLLYPNQYFKKVQLFISERLLKYCHLKQFINDSIGLGSKKIQL